MFRDAEPGFILLPIKTMQKISLFFRTLVLSLVKPSYYNDIVAVPTSFSLKFIGMLSLFLGMGFSIFVTQQLAQWNPNQLIDHMSEQFPDELAVQISPQGLFINQTLPYVVPVNWKDIGIEQPQEEFYLATFNSEANTRGISDVLAAKSFIYLTESSVYTIKDWETKEIQVHQIPVADITETVTITESEVLRLEDMIRNHPFVAQRQYLWLVGIATLVGVTMAAGMSLVFSAAMYGLLLAVITKVLVTTRKLSYTKLFQISLHSLLPFFLYDWILSNYYVLPLTGWMWFVLKMGWGIYLVTQLRAPKLAGFDETKQRSTDE